MSDLKLNMSDRIDVFKTCLNRLVCIEVEMLTRLLMEEVDIFLQHNELFTLVEQNMLADDNVRSSQMLEYDISSNSPLLDSDNENENETDLLESHSLDVNIPTELVDAETQTRPDLYIISDFQREAQSQEPIMFNKCPFEYKKYSICSYDDTDNDDKTKNQKKPSTFSFFSKYVYRAMIGVFTLCIVIPIYKELTSVFM